MADIAREESCGSVEALMTFGLRVVLAAMSRSPRCYEHLVLKGGTALRLMHGRPIGRVSTDIDLSHLDGSGQITPEDLIGDVTTETAALLAETFSDSATVQIRLLEDRTQPPHPELPKMYSFRLFASAQLGSSNPTRADHRLFLLELVIDEYVDRDLLEDLDVRVHGMPIKLRAYAPVQAMAEKLRALLQKLHHYEERHDPASFQPRHVLDLQLLYDHLRPGDLERLKPLFDRKCEVRLIPPEQRTRARLLHPVLREMVEAEAKLRGIGMVGWARLEELAGIVCAS